MTEETLKIIPHIFWIPEQDVKPEELVLELPESPEVIKQDIEKTPSDIWVDFVIN